MTSLFSVPFIVANEYELASDNSFVDSLRGTVYSEHFKYPKYVFKRIVALSTNLYEYPDAPGSFYRVYVV